MASKLVGVRLPPATYSRLQEVKLAIGAAGDAEALRRLVEEYPLATRPGSLPVFASRAAGPVNGRRESLATRHDEFLYGPARAGRRRRTGRRGKA